MIEGSEGASKPSKWKESKHVFCVLHTLLDGELICCLWAQRGALPRAWAWQDNEDQTACSDGSSRAARTLAGTRRKRRPGVREPSPPAPPVWPAPNKALPHSVGHQSPECFPSIDGEINATASSDGSAQTLWEKMERTAVVGKLDSVVLQLGFVDLSFQQVNGWTRSGSEKAQTVYRSVIDILWFSAEKPMKTWSMRYSGEVIGCAALLERGDFLGSFPLFAGGLRSIFGNRLSDVLLEKLRVHRGWQHLRDRVTTEDSETDLGSTISTLNFSSWQNDEELMIISLSIHVMSVPLVLSPESQSCGK